MSCFIVSNNHINALLTFANSNMSKIIINNDKYLLFLCDQVDDLQSLAQLLLDENYRQYNIRYRNEGGEAPEVNFEFFKKNQSLIEIIKACQCLQYQYAESDDYNQTDAYLIVEQIKTTALMKYLNGLSEYEKAPWGID